MKKPQVPAGKATRRLPGVSSFGSSTVPTVPSGTSESEPFQVTLVPFGNAFTAALISAALIRCSAAATSAAVVCTDPRLRTRKAQ